MKTKSRKSSSSDSNSESEHELSYYAGDRIKLMQQALKLIKPKKLISMTPDCIKELQLPAIKSLLLEELLGISNKRLRLILAGENLDVNSSSSSESDLESKKDDIISLDDISDSSEICISDDNCMEIQLSERERLEMEIERPKVDKKLKGNNRIVNKVTVKREHKKTKKHRKKKPVIKKEKDSETNAADSVMNVLNLLELQARARAIRSQLANEVIVDKPEDVTRQNNATSTAPRASEGEDSASSVIFVSPKSSPVVLVRSESETEEPKDNNVCNVTEEKSAPNNDITDTNDTLKLENLVENPLAETVDNDDYSNDVLIVSEDSILDKETEESPEKMTEDNAREDGASTWKDRWLDSPKIKDVLRTNKMYNNLRQTRKQNAASPLPISKTNNKAEKNNETEEKLSSTKENNKVSHTDNVNSTQTKVQSE